MMMQGDDAMEEMYAHKVTCEACGDENATLEGGCQTCEAFWAFCHCGALFPLNDETFDKGYPDSMYEPGQPPQVMCPVCMDEERVENACPSTGCPWEPRGVGEMMPLVAAAKADAQAVFRRWVTGELSAKEFLSEWGWRARFHPTFLMDKNGEVVFDAFAEAKQREAEYLNMTQPHVDVVKLPNLPIAEWNVLSSVLSQVHSREAVYFSSQEEYTLFARAAMNVLRDSKVARGDE